MENKNKPAYPVRGATNAPIDMNDGFPWEKMSIGLTKRELIAAMMAQGICVNAGRNSHEFSKPEKISETAIKIADALLEQLNKG